MNLSTGINLQKELNAIMRRVKKPKIHDKEECIFCCDDNYDDGYDYKNHEVYDLEDEDECGGCKGICIVVKLFIIVFFCLVSFFTI